MGGGGGKKGGVGGKALGPREKGPSVKKRRKNCNKNSKMPNKTAQNRSDWLIFQHTGSSQIPPGDKIAGGPGGIPRVPPGFSSPGSRITISS